MDFNATWLGVGVKSGGILGIGGVESTSGIFFNVGNPSYTHTFSMTSSRWGLGLGGGGGLVGICVFKLNALAWLDGQVIEDWGVNVSMGGRWKDVAKVLQAKRFFHHIKMVKAIGSLVTNLDEVRNIMHYLYTAYDFDANGDHPMLSFDIPAAGIGLELSAFKTSGKMWID